MPRFLKPLGLLCFAIATAGCAVGPEHRAPSVQLATQFRLSSPSQTSDPDAMWWKAYRSPLINEWVARGLGQNLQVQQAMQRVVEARARLGATSWSVIGGDARATGELASGAAIEDRFARHSVLQAGLSANAAWQLDLFGQFKRLREAGRANLDIATIDVKAAQLQFVAEVVDAVIDALAFREGEIVARQNYSSQQRLVASLRQQLARGETTSLAVARAEALRSATAAQIPAFAAGYQTAISRLSVLLDEPAAGFDAQLRRAPPLSLPTFEQGHGRPADLLRRRPDIRRAERALALATAEAGAAEAQLYPSITLRGSISVADLALAVGTAGRFGTSLGPQITIPLLDLPRLSANTHAARSIIESRHLEWRANVIAAVAEVDSSLARLRASRQSAARLLNAVEANERASRLVRTAFGLGAATHSEVLDVERSLAISREQLVNGRQQQAKHFAQLHIALGAGSQAALVPGELRHRHIADHRPLPWTARPLYSGSGLPTVADPAVGSGAN